MERIEHRLSLDTIVVPILRELKTTKKRCQLCNSFFVTATTGYFPYFYLIVSRSLRSRSPIISPISIFKISVGLLALLACSPIRHKIC